MNIQVPRNGHLHFVEAPVPGVGEVRIGEERTAALLSHRATNTPGVTGEAHVGEILHGPSIGLCRCDDVLAQLLNLFSVGNR